MCPSISEYVDASLPPMETKNLYTKKKLTEEKREFLRKRAKMARKVTKKNRK